MGNSQINIRKAAIDDVLPMYYLEEQYIQEIEPENLTKWRSAEPRIKNQSYKSLDKTIVAEDNNKIIGHSYWEVEEEEAQIFSIYVARTHRRKGLASRIMRITEEDCKEAGYTNISLKTCSTNPAQFLFHRMGYTFTEEKEGWLYFEKSF